MSNNLGTLTLDLIARIGGFTAPLDQAAREADTKMRRISASTDAASNAIEGLGGKAKALAGAIGVGLGAAEILKVADQYTELQNRLKLVTNSEYDLATATQSVFAIAQATRTDVASTAIVYQKFAAQTDLLGLSQLKVAEITKTVSQAVALSGGSSESAAAAIQQFGQSLASGVLRGDEFNSVAEQAPGLLKALSQGLGVAQGELRKMAADGKLTTDVLVNGLSKASVQVQKDFEKTAPTIAQAIDQINTAKINFFGDQARDSAQLLSTALSGIAHNFESIATAGEILAAGSLAYYFANGALAVKANTLAMIENRAVLLASLEAEAASTAANVASTAAIAEHTGMQVADANATMLRMSGLQRIGFVQTTLLPLQNANTAAIAAHTVAVEADVVANAALRGSSVGLLGVLAGPVGLAVTVAAVAAGYLLMGNNAEKASHQLSELGSSAQEQAEKFASLSRETRESFLLGITSKIQEDEAKIKKATDNILNSILSMRMDGGSASVPIIDNMIKNIASGSITVAAGMKQIRDQKLLPQSDVDILTAFSVSLDEANKSLADNQSKSADYAKANRILVKSYDDLDESVKGLAARETALQLQRDLNGKDLKKIATDNKKALADLQDPTEYGKALRDIQLQQKAFADGGMGKVFNQKDIDGLLATAKAKDDYKESTDRAKKAEEESRRVTQQHVQDLQKLKDAYLTFSDQIKSPFAKIDEETAQNLKSISLASSGAFVAKQHTTTADAPIKFTTPKGATVAWDKTQGDFIKGLETISPEARADALAGYENYLNSEVKLKLEKSNELVNISKSEKSREAAIAIALGESRKAAIVRGYDEDLANLTDRTKSEKEIIAERYDFEKRKIDEIVALDPRTAAHKKAMQNALSANQQTDTNNVDIRSRQDRDSIFQRVTDAQDQSNHDDQKIGMGNAQSQLFDEEFEIRKQYADQVRQLEMDSELESSQARKDEIAQRIADLQAAADQEVAIVNNSATAKKAINDELLQNSSDFFGNLSSLSASKNKELAAIGKAAAIAQATIDGVLAVQKTLSTVPYPFSIPLAAAVGISAAVNVAKIAGVGFKDGGYTGDGPLDEVAGPAHRGEFYLNAQRTKQYRPVLDAIHSGTFDPSIKSDSTQPAVSYSKDAALINKNMNDMLKSGDSASGLNITFQNYGTSKTYDVQQITANEVRIIARDEISSDGGRAAARSLANPNSDFSKAMSQNLMTERSRG